MNEFENSIQAVTVSKQNENPAGSHKIIYSCGHCKKLINTRPTLSRHLMMHTNEKPFKCEQCGKQFRHKNDLFHHYKTHSKPVKCNTCGSAFSKELYLQNHLKKGCPFLESDNDKFAVLPDLTYQCNLCSKILKTKANVVRHLRIHAFNNKESDSKKISKNINRTDEASPATKGCISGGDMSSDNAEDHIKPLEHSVGFECTLCGEQFRFKSFIIIHVRMHLGQRLFKCKHCNKGFYGRYMLRKHEQNHTRPYKCPKCGQGFNRRYLMAHHFNKSHNEEAEDKMKDISFLPEDKLLSCDICGKTMKSYQKSLMQYHIRLHKDVRPHQCKVCQKTFISDIALKKHSFNHSKPYTCQVCDKGFSRRYLMLGHFEKRCKHKLKKQESLMGVELDHRGVTIVVGEEAGENQATIYKSEDEASIKVSSVPFQAETVTEVDEAKGIEVFRCAPCDKTFTARDALSRHIKTFMKSTACRYCKTSFEDKHLTLAHQRCCLGVVDVGGKVKTNHKTARALGEKQEKVLKTMKEMNSKIDCLTAAAVTGTHSADSSHDQEMDTSPTGEGVRVTESSTDDDVKTAASPSPATQQSNTNTNATKAVLKRTMSALSTACQYRCPECVKSFSTARGLKIHAASHVRLYKCETCGQDFTQVGRFRLHLKSHEAGEDGSDNILGFDTPEDNDQPINENQTNQMKKDTAKKLNSVTVVSRNIEMDAEGQFVLSIDNDQIDKDSQKTDFIKGDEERGEEDTAEETTGSVKTDENAVSLRLMQTGTRGRPFSCQMCRRRFTEETGLQQHLSQTHGVK